MTTPQALQRLLTWLSPAFPVGAFAWSAGLETAIAERAVHDAATTRVWIDGNLHHGGLRTDAILLAHAHRAVGDPHALGELADLCLALTPSSERHQETLAIGTAFLAAARAWPSPLLDNLPANCPYPISVGASAAANDIAVEDAIIAFLSSAVQSQVSVAVRLIPLGQTAGLAVIAALEPHVTALAATAVAASLADIGSIAYATDIAQMRHETLGTRIFRS
ncbi:urease accessory protein UreF [Paradevosia shaoguanensis]|uniref:urease accessory protein UreF n=1 Tax=Paradevosia shaoguanensis TaxID=1335043 RepID=UPI0019326146|nr:urease accessory protein UreF [Paradevosia shaoguanensis]